ncbi:MAG: FeoC-like transcriptional regulator [Gammaproteobacteria bacterium]
MILSRVRDYVRLRGEASLSDIALHFSAEPEAVRGMLEVWVGKGIVSRCVISTDCGACCHPCDSAAGEIYTWVAEQPERRHGPPTTPEGGIS